MDEKNTGPLKTVIPIAHKITITPAEESCPTCKSDKLYKMELVEIFDKSDNECKASYYNSIKLFDMMEEHLREKGLSSFEKDDDNFAIKMTFVTSINIISNFIVGEFMMTSDFGNMKVSELLGLLSMAKIAEVTNKEQGKQIEIFISLDPNNIADLSKYAVSQGGLSLDIAKKMLTMHQEDLKRTEKR